MSASQLTNSLAKDPAEHRPRTTAPCESGPPSFPVETDIYILPGGQIIVADMPSELAAGLAALGSPDAVVDLVPASDKT